MPLIVLGCMALIFVALLVTNILYNQHVGQSAADLPDRYRPCVEAVFLMKMALPNQEAAKKQGVTPKDIQDGFTFKNEQKKCPTLAIRQDQNGWIAEAKPTRMDGSVCRIWTTLSTKIETDCGLTLHAVPEEEKEKEKPASAGVSSSKPLSGSAKATHR